MKCRLMTLDDLDAVLAIEHEAFVTPWSRQSFVDELTRNKCARYLVIEQDGEVAGYGGVWFVVDEAHVTNIAIARRFRGKGLGTRLIEDMLQLAADSGMAFMTLEVRRSNHAAIALYSGLGFRQAGVRPGYYTAPKEDALLLTLYFNGEEGNG